MQISTAQLVDGFKSTMNIHQFADSLGVTQEDVIARFRAMTPEEEAVITKALEGLP